MDRIIKEVLAKKAKKARKKSSAPEKKTPVRVEESIPFVDSLMGKVILIYLGGWSIAAPVEEWMFFVEEGFVAWMLFGWVVPLFRALLWPLNVYQALVG
jgi:hypothetical protein